MTSGPKERFAWCMYDFANSGYTTVILTTLFNAYFVSVIAGGDNATTNATLLWTITLAIANTVVLISAPALGAVADHSAAKKRFLIITTFGCVLFTALLSLVGPGDLTAAMLLVIAATIMFAAGENFISAFLPEISPPEQMGRLSGYGWALGYVGGLLTLGLCLLYVDWSEGRGLAPADYLPATNLIVAVVFALAALPTLLWLKERAVANSDDKTLSGHIRAGFRRLSATLAERRRHKDLFRFLGALTIYYSGIHTVIVLAAVYAQEAMGFEPRDTLFLIMLVNITAAVGAFLFGHLQDRIGSRRSLVMVLLVWIVAISMVAVSTSETLFWLAANLIGLALGGAQSGGRALVGQFAPVERSGEYFGLWGLATRLAAIFGPLSYGAVVALSGNNHRIAILSTLLFFIAGLLVLLSVNEQRGRQAAGHHY